jgi:hypothetical protein
MGDGLGRCLLLGDGGFLKRGAVFWEGDVPIHVGGGRARLNGDGAGSILLKKGKHDFEGRCSLGRGTLHVCTIAKVGIPGQRRGRGRATFFFLKVGGLRMLELLPGYLFGERGWHTVEER